MRTFLLITLSCLLWLLAGVVAREATSIRVAECILRFEMSVTVVAALLVVWFILEVPTEQAFGVRLPSADWRARQIRDGCVGMVGLHGVTALLCHAVRWTRRHTVGRIRSCDHGPH